MTNEASEIKEAIVAAGTEIDGKITGDAALRIEGLVKGSIDINGPMTILENGRSEADVQATVVVIKGTHKGNIVASESVQVVAGGIVNGDIQTPSILIEKGAKFSGKMEMTNQA